MKLDLAALCTAVQLSDAVRCSLKSQSWTRLTVAGIIDYVMLVCVNCLTPLLVK